MARKKVKVPATRPIRHRGGRLRASWISGNVPTSERRNCTGSISLDAIKGAMRSSGDGSRGAASLRPPPHPRRSIPRARPPSRRLIQSPFRPRSHVHTDSKRRDRQLETPRSSLDLHFQRMWDQRLVSARSGPPARLGLADWPERDAKTLLRGQPAAGKRRIDPTCCLAVAERPGTGAASRPWRGNVLTSTARRAGGDRSRFQGLRHRAMNGSGGIVPEGGTDGARPHVGRTVGSRRCGSRGQTGPSGLKLHRAGKLLVAMMDPGRLERLVVDTSLTSLHMINE